MYTLRLATDVLCCVSYLSVLFYLPVVYEDLDLVELLVQHAAELFVMLQRLLDSGFAVRLLLDRATLHLLELLSVVSL